MSIKTSKENICLNRIVAQKNELFKVEGDEIVPDIKPDVLKIISSNGTICIYKKEIQDGKVRFDGSIYIYTMYVADDENTGVRSICSSLDFSKTIDLENVKPDMQLESKCDIESIDCKILNGRKISLQANVKMKVCVYSNENVEVLKEINDIPDIQKLNKDYNINSLIGNGTTKAYAKDTISIDKSDNLSEIIKTKISISNKETKVSYNKILVKADANIKIVYLTEDNRINSISSSIPVMGFIDMQNVSDENICDVKFELKNISLKPNNVEEHSIYVEAEIEIGCFVYENKYMEIIQDLYSPTRELEYKQKNINIMQDKRCINKQYNLNKQVRIPEIGKNKIYDVEVKPTILKTQTVNGSITYDGELNMTFLYEENEGSEINSKVLVEPFTFSIEDDKIRAETKIDTDINIIDQNFIVMPDENINIKIDLDFEVNTSNTTNINIISDINENENRNREKYSIIIYYTKPGDTLWNIAKRFGSTIEEIVKVNKIEDPNKIKSGMQLFIPR